MQAQKQKIKKEVNVTHIASEELMKFWPLVEFMLKEGLRHDGNPMSLDHLKKEIFNNRFQLFMMFGSDDGEVKTRKRQFATIVDNAQAFFPSNC